MEVLMTCQPRIAKTSPIELGTRQFLRWLRTATDKPELCLATPNKSVSRVFLTSSRTPEFALRFFFITCTAIVAFAPFCAQAQQSSGGSIPGAMPSAGMLDGLITNQQLLGPLDSSFAANNSRTDAPPITFRRDPSVNTALTLASTYPAAKRQEVAGVFREMLALYGRVEDRYGLPKRFSQRDGCIHLGQPYCL
jgi:hypothetical protein